MAVTAQDNRPRRLNVYFAQKRSIRMTQFPQATIHIQIRGYKFSDTSNQTGHDTRLSLKTVIAADIRIVLTQPRLV
ncbi:hypothetical protein BaRGS_00007301, partial [Batillaria attramentaria]